MSTAWNRWFHCTSSTYGTWLPGDPRGWRSQYHKIHVEGDYNTPPTPDAFAGLEQHMQQSMRHDAVTLSSKQRDVACRAWAEALAHHQIQFVDLCIGARHWHLLGQFPDGEPRIVIGHVKTWANRKLKLAGLPVSGSAWAKKCKVVPIENEEHWTYVGQTYIPRHAREGAAVWSVIRSM